MKKQRKILMFSNIILTSLLAALLFSCTAQAEGSHLGITRLAVHLNNKTITQPIYLTNKSENKRLAFKVKLADWTRNNGEDVVTDIDNQKAPSSLMVTPITGQLLPLQKQAIRVALKKYSSPNKEVLYRLFVEEIPTLSPSALLDNKKNKPSAVTITTRVSLPVYIYPINANAKLDWRINKTAKGVHVKLNNSGNAHIEINSVDVICEDAAAPLVKQDMDVRIYAKEGAEFDVAIPSSKMGKNMKLRLSIGNGEFVKVTNNEMKI